MSESKSIQIERIKSGTEKFRLIVGLLSHISTILGVVVAIWVIMKGLEPFLYSDPDTINAMAVVLDKINVSNISGYIVATFTSCAWYMERLGKKRAIKEKGKYQKIAEQNDEFRSTSGLTETGETPRD